jgi:hypothetical protein
MSFNYLVIMGLPISYAETVGKSEPGWTLAAPRFAIESMNPVPNSTWGTSKHTPGPGRTKYLAHLDQRLRCWPASQLGDHLLEAAQHGQVVPQHLRTCRPG